MVVGGSAVVGRYLLWCGSVFGVGEEKKKGGVLCGYVGYDNNIIGELLHWSWSSV